MSTTRTAEIRAFAEDLARRYCERLTSRKGCLGTNGYPPDEQCPPCRARAALGFTEAPRRCENCGTEVTADGVDGDGGTTCPPPPHRPHRFYEEFSRSGGSR